MIADDNQTLETVVGFLCILLLLGSSAWWDAKHRARFIKRMESVKDVAIFLTKHSQEEFASAHEALLLVALNRGWNVIGSYNGASELYSDARCGRFEMVLTDSSKGFSDFYAAMRRLYWKGVGMFVLDSSVDCSTKEGLVAYFQWMKDLEPEYAGP
jgi:hypothetical protein